MTSEQRKAAIEWADTVDAAGPLSLVGADIWAYEAALQAAEKRIAELESLTTRRSGAASFEEWAAGLAQAGASLLSYDWIHGSGDWVVRKAMEDFRRAEAADKEKELKARQELREWDREAAEARLAKISTKPYSGIDYTEFVTHAPDDLRHAFDLLKEREDRIQRLERKCHDQRTETILAGIGELRAQRDDARAEIARHAARNPVEEPKP